MMVTLEAVVEAPYESRKSPWPVAPRPGEGLVRLWGGTTLEETGAVVFQLAEYNRIHAVDAAGAPVALLRRIIEAESLVLSGGLAVCRSGGVLIAPGCCCGLEGWRDWASEPSPWLGHCPSPWVERLPAVVRVWADGGLGDAPEEPPFSLDIPQPEFPALLQRVQQDLLDFLVVLEQWTAEPAPQLAPALVERFDRAFAVRAPLEIVECFT